MSLPVLATLTLLFVFAHGEIVSSVTPVTDSYIPHASYPFSDVFGTGPLSAYREAPVATYDDPPSTSLQILETSIKFLAKTGLFLTGGVVFVFLGIIFSYTLCSITPLCTFEFNGWSAEANMQALITPKNVARALDIYNAAMAKYGERKTGETRS